MKKLFTFILYLSFVLQFSPALDAYNKPIITVMDFEVNKISKSDMVVFLDFLSSYIIETDKFRVLERAQRETLLSEMEFSLSGCADESCQLEIGKLLSADFMILGSLGEVSGKYLINMRLVEVESGEYIRTYSEEFAGMGDMIDAARSIIYSFLDVNLDLEKFSKQSAVKLLQNFILDKYKKTLEQIDKEEYYRWSEEQGYLELLNSSSNAERLALLQEYLYDTRKVGILINPYIVLNVLDLSYLEFISEEEPVVVKSGEIENYSVGIGVSIPYVFESTFSLGLWGQYSIGMVSDTWDEIPGDPIQDNHELEFAPSYDLGLSVGYGDAYRGIQTMIGFGIGENVQGFHLSLEFEIAYKRLRMQTIYTLPQGSNLLKSWFLLGFGYTYSIKP